MPRKTNTTITKTDKDGKESKYNYYRVTATVGKNADGKPIRKQFYGASKKDAEQKRDDYMTGLKQGLSVGYDKATFGKAFEHWLEHVQKAAIGPATYIKYESMHRLHIAPCGLAGMKLVDIRAANIQGVYNELLQTTTAKNIHQIHKLLKVFFKYCLETDALIKSPLLAIKLPDLPKQSEVNTALSDEDIERLVRAAKEDMKNFPFVFAMFTGLRAGELLALKYKDIDFKTDMISVNKNVRYLSVDGKYQPVLSDTKTESSIRKVPILAEIKPMLIAHIENTRKASRVLSIRGDFLLFPSETGTYREQNNFLQSFKRLCDKLGIEKGCTIHSLRHTFCTILARQGVSLLDASKLMGHSNVSITAKVYAHVSDDDKKNAVKKLAAYFG
jgi:integrase